MIICTRGHLGTGRSTEIKFAIAAENLLHACNVARKMPSVKHSRIALSGYEVSYEEFTEYRKISAYDRLERQGKRCY